MTLAGKPAKEIFDQAYCNILQFIEDCEIPLEIETFHMKKRGGPVEFELTSPLIPGKQWEIKMPAIPLERLRFMNESGQAWFHFVKIDINGMNFSWFHALIRKDSVLQRLQNERILADAKVEAIDRLIANVQEFTPKGENAQ